MVSTEGTGPHIVHQAILLDVFEWVVASEGLIPVFHSASARDSEGVDLYVPDFRTALTAPARHRDGAR
jgi:hypothetical protein